MASDTCVDGQHAKRGRPPTKNRDEISRKSTDKTNTRHATLKRYSVPSSTRSHNREMSFNHQGPPYESTNHGFHRFPLSDSVRAFSRDHFYSDRKDGRLEPIEMPNLGYTAQPQPPQAYQWPLSSLPYEGNSSFRFAFNFGHHQPPQSQGQFDHVLPDRMSALRSEYNASSIKAFPDPNFHHAYIPMMTTYPCEVCSRLQTPMPSRISHRPAEVSVQGPNFYPWPPEREPTCGYAPMEVRHEPARQEDHSLSATAYHIEAENRTTSSHSQLIYQQVAPCPRHPEMMLAHIVNE
ncbi:hypothetical protein KEM54_004646 [Ascosphaera aggregata]|nr:hypothetical protein KEM54_004646 [Ascosphaera aggregata]